MVELVPDRGLQMACVFKVVLGDKAVGSKVVNAAGFLHKGTYLQYLHT